MQEYRRNKDIGATGNGGYFAPKVNTEDSIVLNDLVTGSPADFMDRLRDDAQTAEAELDEATTAMQEAMNERANAPASTDGNTAFELARAERLATLAYYGALVRHRAAQTTMVLAQLRPRATDADRTQLRLTAAQQVTAEAERKLNRAQEVVLRYNTADRDYDDVVRARDAARILVDAAQMLTGDEQRALDEERKVAAGQQTNAAPAASTPNSPADSFETETAGFDAVEVPDVLGFLRSKWPFKR